jgi:hypothetical protein
MMTQFRWPLLGILVNLDKFVNLLVV